MFNFKKKKERFNYLLLNNNIGSLEGETDKNLEKTFIITNQILKILNDEKYNYVIGCFGSGKSALFKALQKKYIIDKQSLNKSFFSDKSIIALNKGLNFDKTLSGEAFSLNDIILNWAIYILKKMIADILENHKDKKGYEEFKKNISFYEEFKEEFELHNYKDWLKKLSISPSLCINGVNISATLNLKKKNKKEIDMNELYNFVSNFYKINDIKCWILIDKIDDFVRFENYENRKKYIQGLHELIEEIRLLDNIRPILFLREDLFENLNFSIGRMKIEDRAIYLVWSCEEILHFIFKRSIIQPAFQIYSDNLKKMIDTNYNPNRFAQFFYNLLRKNKKEKYNSLEHKVIKEIIYFIYPPEIKIKGKTLDLEEMLRNFLIDKEFINPRVFILFLNKLNEEQFNYYSLNPPNITKEKVGVVKKVNEYDTINVYNDECIIKSLNHSKALTINHIKGLFPDEKINLDKCFSEIDKKLQKNKKIRKNDFINILKKFLSEENEINFIIHYLKVVRYIYENEREYVLSNVYKNV